MGRSSFNGFVVFGVILALFGLVGLAIPIFSTEQTKDVAKVGDLKLQTTERTWHDIPPPVSGGALVLGIILTGVGIVRTR